MALFTLVLLLSIGLQGCALATYDIDDLQSVPDAERTGDVCKDCTQIFELLVDLMSNPDLQKKVMNGIESVCDHLPGPATTRKLCKEEVEKMLPVAIRFVTVVMKPAQICKAIGLCKSCEKQEIVPSFLLKDALQVAGTSEDAQTNPQCSFCILLVHSLENLMPKERTEEAVIKALEEVCHYIPQAYRSQCENVISKFGKTVLDAIMSYATPQTICALIHMCKGEATVVDPCTLSTYRCKDIRTALKCGTLFYCQRFTWKPLSYNAI